MALEIKVEENPITVQMFIYDLGFNSFSHATKMMSEAGHELVTSNLLAQSRIHTGNKSAFSKKQSWVKEGSIYIPAKIAGKTSVVLVPQSLVFENLAAAYNHLKRGEPIEYPYLDKTMHMLELAKSGKSGFYLLQDTESVPTDRFGEADLTNWLFGRDAQKYGDFLKEAGIKNVPCYFYDKEYIDNQYCPYISQLWFGDLGRDSTLDVGHTSMVYGNVTFAVPIKP